jgi:hypothetical protein
MLLGRDAETDRDPSSWTMYRMVPRTPLYGPTGTIVFIRGLRPVVWSGSRGAFCPADDLVEVPELGVLFDTAICPRRITVSSGNFTKISAIEMKKDETACAVGVRSGSMRNQVRKKRGREVDRTEGMVLWSRVIGMSAGGQDSDGSARRDGRRVRGPCVVGVMINLSSH